MYIYETGSEEYALIEEFAKKHRKYPTEAERILWELIKSRQLGTKFRRQHIIGNYIADFANLHYHLVIEIDGGYHLEDSQFVKDEYRTEKLAEKGFEVIRFSNEEVIGNPERTLSIIKQKIMEIESRTNNVAPLPSEGSGEAAAAPSARAAWAVDAACSGNPGPMEYQAVDLATGAQLFHFGPIKGTNNIGEFLAIVHALALMEKQGITDKVIYSDSYNAILWVNKKQCKTKLERTPETEKLYQIIYRAETWLRTHAFRVPIIKWDTQNWGEIPADFGRK
jgi:very-short-patch-repair endonuclease/ribonuclease HI